MELLELSKKKNFVIIEDDYDHEFHFDARPVLPLKTRDRAGTVLHIGTLSKILAPGLRIGYAVGQQALIERMAQNRLYIDRQGDQTLELALAYLIEDGELGAHVRRMHRSYRQRRLALFEALGRHLNCELSYERPAGGLAVWARVRGRQSAAGWAERAQSLGVVVQPARLFFMDGRDHPFLRLGYARLAEAEISEAVKRLERALGKRS
jgi:GntR family transcriptional regulator/MocR family aminotransferase